MIKLLITDLDNTLYDWVDFYVPAFNAMISKLSELTNIDSSELRASFKRVHEKHLTTEFSFAIQELDVLAEIDQNLSVREILRKYEPAIDAFRDSRTENLKLYEGVLQTLRELKRQGRLLVAHTDSMIFYATYRLKQLGIESLFDGLIALRDHGLPAGTAYKDVRRYNDPSRYTSSIEFVREIDPSLPKPNSECITDVLERFDVASDETVYVGDSLYKDIYMAQMCSLHDVFAVYGREYDQSNYQQLIQITHWTEEDVKRELALKQVNIEPSFTIGSFSEILEVLRSIESIN